MKKIYLILGITLFGWQYASAQYCVSTATSNFDTETWNVTLNGQSQNINQQSGALGGGLSGKYTDYTSQVADVVPTLSYAVSTVTGDDGNGPTYYSRRTAVYIDWNQDNDFLDAGELLGTSPLAGGAPISANFPFTVPMAAVTGMTRMRVVTIETSAVPPSCSTYTYGETEDYSINVLPLPTCLPVTSPNATLVAATSAQIGWTLLDGLQTNWIIEYGLDGFTPGSGTQIPVVSNPYILTGLDPETAYDVYVYADCGGGDISYASPVVSLTTTPLCPKPTAPVTTLITTNSALLGWTPGSTETIWDVEWQLAGFLLGTGNQDFGLSVSNDPLAGLSSQSNYHWYVRAVCDLNTGDGVDTVSYFVGPNSFATPSICANPSALNVTNNIGFESDLGWTAGAGETEWNIQWGLTGFPLNGTGSNLVSNNIFVPYNLTGLTPGTSYQFYVQAVCGSTADSTSAWVGPFTWTTTTFCPIPSGLGTTAISTTSASVDWTENGSATNWTVEYGVNGFTPGTGTQIMTTVPNTSFTGLTTDVSYCFYVQANCGSTVDSSSAWAGPFCFTTISTCPQPSNLGVMNITFSAANLFWQAGGSETAWDIEWGAPGFTVGNGEEAGSVTGTSSNPYYVTGLNESAPYVYYVRAACGGVDGNSLWAGPFAFKTTLTNNLPCDAIEIIVDAPMIQHYNNTATASPGEVVPPIVAGQCLSQTSWCTSPSSATVWFSFIAPSTGSVVISTFGAMTNFRTQIAAYSTGDCSIYANYDLQGANTLDPASTQPPFGSTLTLCSLTAGEQYLVKVDAGTTTGPGNFGIAVNSVDPNVSAGSSVGAEVCENTLLFNLFQTITGNSSVNGSWYSPSVSAANELAGSVVDFNLAGVYPFFYVDGSACGMDTVETFVDVVSPADAGINNAITTCNTGSITLIIQLNGTPEFGGTWSDDDNTGELSNGEFNAQGFAAGTYDFTYTLSSANACPDQSSALSITLTDCIGLGIDDNGTSSLSVYPNPVADMLTIQNLSIKGNAVIEVLDVRGKIVNAIEVADVYGNYELEMSNLESGVYIIRITAENKVSAIRVVKQ